MSYNPTPEWATVKLDPRFIDIRCPYCRTSLFKIIQEAFSEAQTAGYYHPAHIPPTFDVDCPECEKNISVPIRVEIRCDWF